MFTFLFSSCQSLVQSTFRFVRFSLPLLATSASFAQTPNVIFFMVDDMGPGEFKAYDNLDGLGATSKIATPNIDALAQNGMLFNNAHSATPVCSPTRTTLNTGTTAYQNEWTWDWGSPFAKELVTLPKMMKTAGYQTALVGKGHLGGDMFHVGQDYLARIKSFENLENLDFDRPLYDGPQSIGYDYSLYLLKGIQDGPYFYWENGLATDVDAAGDSTRITNATKSQVIRQWPEEYDDGITVIDGEDWGSVNWNTRDVPLAMLHKSIDFMEQTVSSHSDKPFFLQYHSVLGHSPYVPLEKIEIDLNGDGDVNDEGEFYLIDGYDGTGTRADDLGTLSMQVVSETDAEVGVLIAYLSQTDDPRNPGSRLIDNTVFIFTSDNGGIGPGFTSYVGNDEEAEWRDYGHDSTAGLSGNKTESDEGGHRVPYIVSWPTSVEAGAVREQYISTTDLMATLASLTGQNVIDYGVASFNMLPVFTGKQTDDDPVRKNLIVNDTGGSQDKSLVRNIYYEGSWKLILEARNSVDPILYKVFNLDVDPGETNNLVDSGNEIISQLYQNYLIELNAVRISPALIGKNSSRNISDLETYSDLTVEGSLMGGGTVNGNLEINSEGRLDLNSAAVTTTTVNGDFIFRSGAFLNLSIGMESDRLDVKGTMRIDGGELAIAFYENFIPAAGQEFDISDFSKVEGEFLTVNLPQLPMGLSWNTEQLSINGVLRIVSESTPSPTPVSLPTPTSTATPTPTPSPVIVPSEATRIEAEVGSLAGMAMAYADGNASGGQAVAYLNELNSSIEFLNLPTATQLVLSYASMFSGEISYSINSGQTRKLSFNSTGDWVGVYQPITVDLEIPASSTLKIFFEEGDTALNIDYIQLENQVPQPTPTPTIVITPLPTPEPTAIPTATATPIVTATPTATPTPSPGVPTPSPSFTATPGVGITPAPTPTSAPVDAILIEAESGVLNGIAAPYTDNGASGNQGIAYISEEGASVEFFNLPFATKLTVAYASENTGAISLSIDDGEVIKLPFESTGSWVNQYNLVELDLVIPSSSKLKLFYEAGDAAMNIDFLEFTSVAIATPSPSPTPNVVTPSPTPTPDISAPSPTPSPSATPSVMPTPTITPGPSITPEPQVTPTTIPTISPTAVPTATPTPFVTPSSSPTVIPTPLPSLAPTAEPEPTPLPTPEWYYLVHKPTGFKVHSCETRVNAQIGAASDTVSDDCVQWRQVLNGEHFYIEHKVSRKFIKPDTLENGSLVSLQPDSWLGSWTQWRYEARADGYGHLINRATGKFLYMNHGFGSSASVRLEQQPASWRGDYTRWQFQLAK